MNELTFDAIPANKAEQKALAEQLIAYINDGEINPLEAVVKVKSISEVINAVLKDQSVVDQVITELEKYGKAEKPGYNGAIVEARETGVKYDYSICGDIVWNELNSQLDELKEAIKVREKYLKAIKSRKPEIDPETGEVYEIIPPVRTSTSTFAITFKKG